MAFVRPTASGLQLCYLSRGSENIPEDAIPESGPPAQPIRMLGLGCLLDCDPQFVIIRHHIHTIAPLTLSHSSLAGISAADGHPHFSSEFPLLLGSGGAALIVCTKRTGRVAIPLTVTAIQGGAFCHLPPQPPSTFRPFLLSEYAAGQFRAAIRSAVAGGLWPSLGGESDAEIATRNWKLVDSPSVDDHLMIDFPNQSRLVAIGEFAFADASLDSNHAIKATSVFRGDRSIAGRLTVATTRYAFSVPEGVKIIDDSAFFLARVASLLIPSTLAVLGKCAFADTFALAAVRFHSE
jgi:hypothetical protein